jgi:mxaJ protein
VPARPRRRREHARRRHALARRGIVRNVSGFTLLRRLTAEANPPARIVEAVARETWTSRLSGARSPDTSLPAARSLRVVPVSPTIDLPFLPFVYDIAVGVRRGEDGLRRGSKRASSAARRESRRSSTDTASRA